AAVSAQRESAATRTQAPPPQRVVRHGSHASTAECRSATPRPPPTPTPAPRRQASAPAASATLVSRRCCPLSPRESASSRALPRKTPPSALPPPHTSRHPAACSRPPHAPALPASAYPVRPRSVDRTQ